MKTAGFSDRVSKKTDSEGGAESWAGCAAGPRSMRIERDRRRAKAYGCVGSARGKPTNDGLGSCNTYYANQRLQESGRNRREQGADVASCFRYVIFGRGAGAAGAAGTGRGAIPKAGRGGRASGRGSRNCAGRQGSAGKRPGVAEKAASLRERGVYIFHTRITTAQEISLSEASAAKE